MELCPIALQFSRRLIFPLLCMEYWWCLQQRTSPINLYPWRCDARWHSCYRLIRIMKWQLQNIKKNGALGCWSRAKPRGRAINFFISYGVVRSCCFTVSVYGILVHTVRYACWGIFTDQGRMVTWMLTGLMILNKIRTSGCELRTLICHARALIDCVADWYDFVKKKI